MKNILFLFLFVVFISALFGQTKEKIDSVNNIVIQVTEASNNELEKLFLENKKQAHDIQYSLGEANALLKLAILSSYDNKAEKSMQYFTEGIDILEKAGLQKESAYMYAELGYNIKRRDLERANYFMRLGKSLGEKHQSPKLKSIYNNYGVLKEMESNLDSAEFYYAKSLDMERAAADSVGIGYSLGNLAGIEFQRKNYNTAIAMLNEVLQIRKNVKDRFGEAETYHNLGYVYLEKGDNTLAINQFTKSMNLAQEVEYQRLLNENYKMLSTVFERTSQIDSALFYNKLHVSLSDSIKNAETEKKISELTVQFETEKKNKKLAENQLHIRKQKVIMYVLIALALVIALLGFLFWRQQKLKNQQQKQEHELKQALAEIEGQNKLHQQRLSISKDLHDNIGSQLTFIISSIDTLSHVYQPQNEQIKTRFIKIKSFASETITDLRDTIWAMNQDEIDFDAIEQRLISILEKARTAFPNLHLVIEFDDNLKGQKLMSTAGMQIYRAVQEAINNALKYADASEIKIKAKSKENNFEIEVSDNGKGFDQDLVIKGNGLHNMQKRMENLQGSFAITSTLNQGTSVKFTFPKNGNLA